ncbi:MAG: hypothetical protein ABJ275_07180 [Maricaulaceae bacterium]
MNRNIIKIKLLNLSRFFKNESGHFGLMGALSMGVLLLFIGATLDQTRIYEASEELQSIVDAAVISVSLDPELSESERQEKFRSFIEDRFADNELLVNPNFELATDLSAFDIRVTADISSGVNTLFGFFQSDNSNVSAAATTVTDSRTVEIALVLDISTSMTDSRLLEMKAAAKGFIEDIFANASSERLYISMVPYGGAVRLPPELISFLDPPEAEVEKYWQGGVWNGCLLMEPNDYQSGIANNGAFPYLPSYYTFGGSNGERNPWCPRAGNEVVGLTQDKQILFDTIDSFARSDGTVSGIGAAWGLTTLEPTWRNIYPNTESNLPFDFASNRRKIIILMSDGGSSHLIYPRDDDFEEALPFHVSTASTRRFRSSGEQNAAQQRTCDHIKSRGVDIYTVGFQIRNNTHRNNLASCASVGGGAFDADAGDLDESFNAIATQIANTRLTGS